MDVKEAMTKALAFEQKGYEIYTETAAKTQNPIVKSTFEYLAKQEINHINEIKDYLEAEKIEMEGDTLKETSEFFNMTVKEFKDKTEMSDEDTKAFEAGLELEKNAYGFYKEHFENADNEVLKKFFDFLMIQENAHYEFIEKTLNFIKSPEHFYAEEEGWHVDGG